MKLTLAALQSATSRVTRKGHDNRELYLVLPEHRSSFKQHPPLDPLMLLTHLR